MTLTPERRAALEALVDAAQPELARRAAAAAKYDWSKVGRPDQQIPDKCECHQGKWACWLNLGGRGSGKTRTGAETVRRYVNSGKYNQIAMVAPTTADVRDVMVEGPESGIMAVFPNSERPTYEPSKRKLTFKNGAIAHLYSADEPDRLRGPQHAFAWSDEVAAWRYPEAWSNLMLGLRLGSDVKTVVTTTPKPVMLVRQLIKDPSTHLTRSTTYDNRANLAPQFFDTIIRQYEGTRLGRQELEAELLDDAPGAMWQRSRIDALRIVDEKLIAECIRNMRRIVVAIDPSATSNEDSDEAGVIVAGVGHDGHGYLIEDCSARMTPHEWAKLAIDRFHFYKADAILGEVNNGGDMVEQTLRTVDPLIPFKKVWASKGKAVRAEPVSAFYEQNRVHHLGKFDQCEDQMCAFTVDEYLGPGSPDRADALTYAFMELMVGGSAGLTVQFFPDFAVQ